VYAIGATDKCKKIEKYDSLGNIECYFSTNLYVFYSRKKTKVKYYIKIVGKEWKGNKSIIITNVILFLS